jgi:hypothetical protein
MGQIFCVSDASTTGRVGFNAEGRVGTATLQFGRVRECSLERPLSRDARREPEGLLDHLLGHDAWTDASTAPALPKSD